MPNHLHILIFTPDPDQARWKLGVDLRAWTQRFHPGLNIWSPIPKAITIPNSHHLKRQIRYVHLNPCRAGLASDPLQWEWSTHRDVTGCVGEAWPDLPKLMKIYEVPSSRLGDVIHRYVSGDPSVAVGGTPMVRSPRPGEPVLANISIILKAAAIARREDDVIQRGKLRDIAVQISTHLGMTPEPGKLRMSQKTWDRALKRQPDVPWIQATMKILVDPRCRVESTLPNDS